MNGATTLVPLNIPHYLKAVMTPNQTAQERMTATRVTMLAAIVAAARSDERIVGLVEYGSGSEGRDDSWSDLDLALFIRDADLASFSATWSAWAGQFGQLLLAYIGGIGHPWTIYATDPVPLRVDFAFHAASTVERILDWPNAPRSAEAMVLHDATGGHLTTLATRLVGQHLGPVDLRDTFNQVVGDIWYFTLRTWGKLQRGDWWGAYTDAQHILLGNLLALLRLECGATARWRSTSAATWIERELSPERLAALKRCLPATHQGELHDTIRAMAALAATAGLATAERQGWPWPHDLVERVQELLELPPGGADLD